MKNNKVPSVIENFFVKKLKNLGYSNSKARRLIKGKSPDEMSRIVSNIKEEKVKGKGINRVRSKQAQSNVAPPKQRFTKQRIHAVLCDGKRCSSFNVLLKSLKLSKKMKLSPTELDDLRSIFSMLQSPSLDIAKRIVLETNLLNICNSIDFAAAKSRWKESDKKQKRKVRGKAKKSNGSRKNPPKAKPKPPSSSSTPIRPCLPPLAANVTTQDILNSRRNIRQIGMGLDSSFEPQKIRTEEVKIDEHTSQKSLKKERHILYAAGWSTKGDFSE